MRLAGLVLFVPLLGLTGCTIDNYYTGEPFQTSHKVEVRRPSPTREELSARPPTPYEYRLREAAAEEERLRVPLDLHEGSRYIERGGQQVRVLATVKGDPWQRYEADRKRALYRAWSDVGGPSPAEPEAPRAERPIEEDPYAPGKKITKKEAPAEGDEKPAEGEKPPEDKK